MKMGTIASLQRYDAATCAIQSAMLRHPTTLHYAEQAVASRFGRVIRFILRLLRPVDHSRHPT
jgi:hypothetical protein